MITIKNIIEKLQELNDEDYKVNIEVQPEINCLEDYSGNGWETTKYIYTITLESDEKTRKYINKNGIKEYIKGE